MVYVVPIGNFGPGRASAERQIQACADARAQLQEVMRRRRRLSARGE